MEFEKGYHYYHAMTANMSIKLSTGKVRAKNFILRLNEEQNKEFMKLYKERGDIRRYFKSLRAADELARREAARLANNPTIPAAINGPASSNDPARNMLKIQALKQTTEYQLAAPEKQKQMIQDHNEGKQGAHVNVDAFEPSGPPDEVEEHALTPTNPALLKGLGAVNIKTAE